MTSSQHSYMPRWHPDTVPNVPQGVNVPWDIYPQVTTT